MRDLQPDIKGYMATLGTTNEPLRMCFSCQRALIYGAMMYAGSVKAEVDLVDSSLKSFNPVEGAKALKAAKKHAEVLVQMLAEFVKADMVATLPGATDLSEDDWAIAMASFFQARCEHYVDSDGMVMFEPHGDEDEAEADPDDGVPAA